MENKNQNQNTDNTLNHLNTVLFGALNQVIEGSMEEKKAQVISNLGSQIINNAKTQLKYYQLTGNNDSLTVFSAKDLKRIPVISTTVSPKKELSAQEPYKETPEEIAYAAHRKYKNVPEGMVVEGKNTFRENALVWASENLVEKEG